jgi:hypothetical protein
MARRPYAGTADAYVIDSLGRPLAGRDESGNVLVAGRAYTAETGGDQITDLQTLDGSPISNAVLVPAQDGRIPRFLGPDGIESMWLDFGGGRFLFNATDIPARVATLEIAGAGGGGSAGLGMPLADAVVISSQWHTSRPASNPGAYMWVCDGVADQVEIQAAIDAVAAQGGGRVLLLGPEFYISAAIKLKTAIHLQGGGAGTRIIPATDFQTGMIMLADNTVHLTTLSDLTLYPNGAEVHGVHYIANGGQVYSSPAPNSQPDPGHIITRLFIRGCGDSVWPGTGMLLEGGNLRAGKYSDIRIQTCSGNGVWIKGAVDSHFTNIEVGSSGTGSPTLSASSAAPIGHAFYIGAGDNCMFTACKGWYSRWAGFYNRSTRTGLTNCQAQDNYGDGFVAEFGKITFIGCHADSNGQGKDPTRGQSGFRVTSGSAALVGCASYDRGGQAWQQQNGFSFTSGFANGRVVGCMTWGNAVASVAGAAASSTTVDVAAGPDGH